MGLFESLQRQHKAYTDELEQFREMDPDLFAQKSILAPSQC